MRFLGAPCSPGASSFFPKKEVSFAFLVVSGFDYDISFSFLFFGLLLSAVELTVAAASDTLVLLSFCLGSFLAGLPCM